jgi:two-component system sensor histidine kinase UhpB
MRRPSLFTQILAVNSLLITSSVFAATVAAQLHVDFSAPGQRRQFLVIIAGVLLTVLANAFVLRRRLAPLERLIDTMERVNLNEPGLRAPLRQADSRDVVRLNEAFNHMLARIELTRAQSARAVLRAQEDERARVARDLHDEVNQALTGVLLRLEASASQAPPGLRDELRETKALATQAMRELVGLARELRPTALDDHGLDAALRTQLEQFSERTGIRSALHIDGQTLELTSDQQLVVYRIVQESLSNAARHASAGSVRVDMRREHGQTEVRVADDGDGFVLGARKSRTGLGLHGMRERALLVGGRLVVRSSPGSGTTVELRLGGAR